MTPHGPIECNRRVSMAMKRRLRTQIRIFGDDQHMGDSGGGVIIKNSNFAGISVPIPITDHLGVQAFDPRNDAPSASICGHKRAGTAVHGKGDADAR
jgi:hypothetical protein